MNRLIPTTFPTLLLMLLIATTLLNVHFHANAVPSDWHVFPLPPLLLLEKPYIPQDSAPMYIIYDTYLISPDSRSFTIGAHDTTTFLNYSPHWTIGIYVCLSPSC